MKRTCLIVADAARARIFTYQRSQEPDGLHDELREERDLIDPARRKRASELFSDSAGANHGGPASNAFDDHRQAHLDRFDASFAREITGELDGLARTQEYRELIVIASSRMLGELRTTLEPLRRTLAIRELERDFTKLTTAELRDRLTKLDLLPPPPPRLALRSVER
jgi:protein required for attachment to host cells